MPPDIHAILHRLRQSMPEAWVQLRINPGPSAQHSLLVSPDNLVQVLHYLRDSEGFDFLSNVTGIDWPDPALAENMTGTVNLENAANAAEASPLTPPPNGFFEVLYHLYATCPRVGPLVLRARTGNRTDAVSLPSVVPVFRSAEFQEREIFDLYGVHFSGHPDLRRILMWDEFTDHPMRRDYVPPNDDEYEPLARSQS